jgi:hypothetical protein
MQNLSKREVREQGLLHIFNCGIDLPVLIEPHEIASLCAIFYFAQELDRLRPIAWLAGIIGRNNQFDFDCDNILVGLN